MKKHGGRKGLQSCILLIGTPYVPHGDLRRSSPATPGQNRSPTRDGLLGPI